MLPFITSVVDNECDDIKTVADIFAGTGAVSSAFADKTLITNDLMYSNYICNYAWFGAEGYDTFKNLDKESVLEWIYEIIEKYGLSLVSKNGYDYYGCESSKGLGDYNREGYLKLRADFNQKHANGNYDYYYYVMLYVIIVYAFNNENVIMIKDQHQQADLVYLVKQTTTSLRLSNAGEIGENIFNGRNVCLWMLTNRKTLNKLSDFKSFHLLDALNDFKKSAINLNLTPEIWITLEQ